MEGLGWVVEADDSGVLSGSVPAIRVDAPAHQSELRSHAAQLLRELVG